MRVLYTDEKKALIISWATKRRQKPLTKNAKQWRAQITMREYKLF